MYARRLALPVLAVALVAGLITGVAFAAHKATTSGGDGRAGQANTANDSPRVVNDGPAAQPSIPSTTEPTVPVEPSRPANRQAEGKAFFTATLNGGNEVPSGQPAGDDDGNARALVEIEGDEISFGLRWKGIGTPVAAHIHRAPQGQNGDVVVPFFAEPLPDGATAVTGRVKAGADVIQRIRANPQNYYVNLHTKEFAGGAVRGQLASEGTATNLDSVLGTEKLVSQNDGRQEIPAGDPAGRATVFIWPWGACLDYAMSWSGIGTPTAAHVHRAPQGQNGDVVGPLFEKLPDSLTGIAGTAEGQDRDVVKRIKANPQNYYTNLHTAEFPKGAVRGQLRQNG